LKKVAKRFGGFKKMTYLCTRFRLKNGDKQQGFLEKIF